MKREKLDDDQLEVKTYRPPGRPSTYDAKRFPTQAKFLASRGATQADIAECFGVSTRTLQNWLAQYPELYEAVQVGNDVFNPRVERALAERAIGFWVSWEDEELHPVTGDKVLVTKKKYFPSNVTAQIYWTKNRMKDKWSDASRVEVDGKLKSSDELLQDFNEKLIKIAEPGLSHGLEGARIASARG